MTEKSGDALSASLEDYLEAIAEIIEEHGHAHTRDIAEKLNVKMPSVTNALWSLSRQSYIIYQPNQPVLLTETGQTIAKSVIRRHEALKRFFQNILCVEPGKANSVACKIEHVIDQDIADRFIVYMDIMSNRTDAQERIAILMKSLEKIRREE